jgi:thioredoxin reductase (NADPH)
MTEKTIPAALTTGARADHVFPKLTAEQMRRVAAHGKTRPVERGDILIEAGDRTVPFFVVTRGAVQIVRPGPTADDLIVEHRDGEFTGETNMLSGRPSLVRARVSEPGEVIELERAHLMSIVQNDPELSDILMRAFILRRVELIAHGFGDAVLLGSNHCAGTLRIREFLTRSGHPFRFVDLDKEADVQELLDRFHVGLADVPVIVGRAGLVLKNPSIAQIADALGFNPAIDESEMRDIVIAGAGPSGLAAAVYGASEGLDVLVLESSAPGGQAGSSSKIENYLGFPTGVSGEELTGRAYSQAEKFEARFQVAKSARELACDRRPYIVITEDGARVPARTVIVATGAEYRKLPIANRGRFEGAGVYYGATAMEAQLCRGEEVIVVGGGNSAGQAAVYLSGFASHVHVLCRSNRLADTMSRYLVDRIANNPRISLRMQTEIDELSGGTHLESVRWKHRSEGTDTRPIRHVFTMTGARPCADWLQGCVTLDENGFIKTGPDLTRDDLSAAAWPLTRPPYHLETSLPGVFAVGDVRSGSMKRVASAVGEGSTAVAFVHRVLKE